MAERATLNADERSALMARPVPDDVNGTVEGVLLCKPDRHLSVCGLKVIFAKYRKQFSRVTDPVDCAGAAVLDMDDSFFHRHTQQMLETYQYLYGRGMMAMVFPNGPEAHLTGAYPVGPGDLLMIKHGIAHGFASETPGTTARMMLTFHRGIAPARDKTTFVAQRDEVGVAESTRELLPKLPRGDRRNLIQAGYLHPAAEGGDEGASMPDLTIPAQADRYLPLDAPWPTEVPLLQARRKFQDPDVTADTTLMSLRSIEGPTPLMRTATHVHQTHQIIAGSGEASFSFLRGDRDEGLSGTCEVGPGDVIVIRGGLAFGISATRDPLKLLFTSQPGVPSPLAASHHTRHATAIRFDASRFPPKGDRRALIEAGVIVPQGRPEYVDIPMEKYGA